MAYHDLTPGNQGGYYRLNEDVDIFKGFVGYVVTNFQTSEWLEYTINVTQSGTYRFDVRVSSQSSTSRFHLEVDRIEKTGIISAPNTGSFTNFQCVGKSGISLTAGQHILRIYVDAGYFNLDMFSASLESASTGRKRAVLP